MARVDQYTTEVFLDRSNASNIEAAAGPYLKKATELMNQSQRYQERGAKAAKLGNEIQAQRDIEGQLKAREVFNNFQRNKIGYLQEQQSSRMTNPDGFAKEFDEWYTVNASEVEEGALGEDGNAPFDRKYFRQLMDQDRTSTFEQNSNWENGMRIKNIGVGIENNVDQMAANFALSGSSVTDLPKALQDVRNYVTTTGAKVLDPEQLQRFTEYGIDKYAAAAISRDLENDPKKLRNLLLYGQATQDQLINFTFDIEGQGQIAQEPNGSIAKYGINGKANNLTDDEVKNLTPEAAREIYKKKYWDPRLEKMDPAFRAVAFDALVNHGNGENTWKMIQEANGDPYNLIQRRKLYYEELVTWDSLKKPEDQKGYANYKKGWDKRMVELTQYVQNQDEGGREFVKQAVLLNPDIIMRAQDQIPGAIDAKNRLIEAQQKEAINQFNVGLKSAVDTITTDLQPMAPDEMNKLEQMAVNTGDVVAQEKFKVLEAQQDYITQLKGLGLEQLQKKSNQIQAEINKAPSADNRMQKELIEKVIAGYKKSVADDGVLVTAARFGQTRMPIPMDNMQPDEMIQEMLTRQESMKTIRATTGESGPIMAPYEIDSMVTSVAEMPAEAAAAALSVFENLDQKTISDIANEFAKKDQPIIAAAMSTEDKNVRLQIIRGSRIENTLYKADDMKATMTEMLTDMYVDPAAQAKIAPAVEAYFKAKSFDERSTDTVVDANKLKAALQKVIAPIVDIGGQEVFTFRDKNGSFVDENTAYSVFNSIDAGTLQRVVGRTVTDAQRNDITDGDVNDFTFVTVDDNKYAILLNGGYIPDPKSKKLEPLILDATALLEDFEKQRGKIVKTKRQDIAGAMDVGFF